MKRVLPWTMIWARAALGPVMVLGARRFSGALLAGIVVFALLDDIFDGILARRWGCETPALRLADTCADTVFSLGVAGALWLRSPELLRRNGWLLAALFALEALRHLFDFAKFGKAASYHSYLAKAWGLVLAAAVVGAFAFAGGGRAGHRGQPGRLGTESSAPALAERREDPGSRLAATLGDAPRADIERVNCRV